MHDAIRDPLAHTDLHPEDKNTDLNWLRAAVLGANDGIVSTAAIIVGVAGASNSPTAMLTAGLAGLTAGALSMGVGEYVSVSTQKDTELALIAKETREIAEDPEGEVRQLAGIYERKGLTKETARRVAEELSEKDALAAHLDAELGINPDELSNPWHAAYASALAFCCGAAVPLVTAVLAPEDAKVPFTFIGVLVALTATGALSAYAGGAKKRVATARVIAGGMLAMVITFGIGKLFGTTLL